MALPVSQMSVITRSGLPATTGATAMDTELVALPDWLGGVSVEVTEALGVSCSEPLGPDSPIAGSMVTVVAPETSQLSVVRSPWIMLVGLAVKELIVGFAAGAGGVLVPETGAE